MCSWHVMGAAVNGGWEDLPVVAGWLHKAVQLSGEEGPVQRVDLQELLEDQPKWAEQQDQIWKELATGKIPNYLAAKSLNRTLVELFLFPAVANLSVSDIRQRGLVFAFSGARQTQPSSAKVVAVDATTLLTLSFLGQLESAFEHFDNVVISHSTLGWLFEEIQRVKFHQPSRIADAHEQSRLLSEGLLDRFEVSATAEQKLVEEVGDGLATMISTAMNASEDDQRQRIVIRPYPVFRPLSFMEERSDLSGYGNYIAGCIEVVGALSKLGQLTSVEEERARAYLNLHEENWPHSPNINGGAVLYLDDLAVSNLQHLGLLGKLKPAGFTVFVSPTETQEQDALLRLQSLSSEVLGMLDGLRIQLASAISTGKVRLGNVVDIGDEISLDIRHHPTTNLFQLADEVDAFVVDDRAINQHASLTSSGSQKPIITSLEILRILNASGVLSNENLHDCLTKLRRGGFTLIPTSTDELRCFLGQSSISGNTVLESAELKAIHEKVQRVRMTDMVQLPKEHVWLDNFLRTVFETLKSEWLESPTETITRIRSNWLLPHFDLRSWLIYFQMKARTAQRRNISLKF